MATFKREFDVDQAKKVVREPENAWFGDLLKRWRPAGAKSEQGDHLRLAIRDGYMNFYRAGQSVAMVKFVRGKLQGEIHNKYVAGDEDSGQGYVKIADGRLKNHDGSIAQYRDGLVDDWILKANDHADEEKRFVDDLVTHQAGAIDLEAALPADPDLWDKNSAPRMDLVALEPCGDHYRLVFWEAKLVTNPEARCEGADRAPRVVTQLKKYEEWLAKNRKLVCEAYQRCCKDLVGLRGIAKALNKDIPELGDAIVAVGQGASLLCVDGTPRLIIDATRGDAAFTKKGHLEKLHRFGLCVRMVRTPADMVMGSGA
jgi:hypothetical protein